MKKIYIVLISILSVIVLFLGFVAGCFIEGKCKYKYENTNEYLPKWMSLISDSTKLNEMIIPGSHDSGSYNMIYLGETQKFSIARQLKLGVRYLDIRIANNEGKYQIFHDIINGVDAEEVFVDIASFLKDNPTEVLLLDFQHFKNGSEEKVIEFINTYLSTYLFYKDNTKTELEFIDSLTLGDVRGKCIIFFGSTQNHSSYWDLPYIFSRNNDHCLRENVSLNSMYIKDYNIMPSAKYIEEGLRLYFDNIKEKISSTSHKGIFVLQGQLTDAKKIYGPWSRERNHDENMQSYISYLKETDDFKSVNVIMRDFINQEKSVNIIRINYYKYNFKPECENTFMNAFKVS